MQGLQKLLFIEKKKQFYKLKIFFELDSFGFIRYVKFCCTVLFNINTYA